MRKIQAIALFVAMLLLQAIATDTQAARRRAQVPEPEPLTEQTVTKEFQEYLQQNHSALSDAHQDGLIQEIGQYLDVLKDRDAKSKAAYVEEKQIASFMDKCREEMAPYSDSKIDEIVGEFLKKYGDRLDNQAYHTYMQKLNDQLGSRVRTLNNKLKSLEQEMTVEKQNGLLDLENLDWKLIGTIVGGVLFLIIIIVIASKSKKKKKGVTPGPVNPRNNYRSSGNGPADGQASADGNIIVRRKTATILKKQSLEDVIDNPNYLQVDAVDFTYESAVRRMYIKNTCIIDIYNMYANDLRNPESPKEDGCMVLGRWVHDPESNEYYVSLEEIVLPGDDAVFEEYALNFGGKIKLKVLEQLRRLRRETNLQYDLTCWVHSHPGLGVFFSNSDTSVQDQLKHPTHPNFLTAIVIDILTPMQDLGIFTFRRDATINSKNDLKKMYSLIEWYQWAKQSAETTPQRAVSAAPKEFKSVDYFNTLEKAPNHHDACHGVQLSRNTVVDICLDLAGQGDDVMAMLHGLASQHGQQVDYLAEKVSDKDTEPKLSLTGCFVAAPHCSIPTVRRAVADYLDRIRFVIVYTPGDGLLTTIPVIDNDLCTDENYYGEQKLDELKTWIKKGR